MAEIVTPEFRDAKDDTYKMISLFTKKARGMMKRFILHNGIDSEGQLQAFDNEGYCYNHRLSEKGRPVFTRGGDYSNIEDFFVRPIIYPQVFLILYIRILPF